MPRTSGDVSLCRTQPKRRELSWDAKRQKYFFVWGPTKKTHFLQVLPQVRYENKSEYVGRRRQKILGIGVAQNEFAQASTGDRRFRKSILHSRIPLCTTQNPKNFPPAAAHYPPPTGGGLPLAGTFLENDHTPPLFEGGPAFFSKKVGFTILTKILPYGGGVPQTK